ncbi:hypothetical protein [Pseudomonas phage HMGUpa2]|uniref:ORF.59 n=2 Tax=Bruynoghevirus TaxID=545932 RepID=Q8H9X3_9CAUD|nr:hypothetical protein [Pseudomonas aeruginosa]NP_775199.1 ORF.59 [Pseudomonas phage PaP3]ATW62374.1 hypothetical protein Delta_p59 [Pseudomonas phage Delta]QIQ66443.1 hypothetical protein clash_11 [Pseudomonas phage clash]QIQ67414.1 hypothetical protein otherone_11 [Pseudomonas phage otherone]QSH71680.1 hypothetical protein [Pseudomonas phage vB_PaeP_fHoPae04]UZV42262.1 hypothetical protein Ka1_15 [Pseudomonas phage Ka1]WFP47231.1 hypothetical protein FJK_gp10 [Pseudomonas phage FJK]WIC41
MSNTTFTVAATRPRNDLHISKRADGVYVNPKNSGDIVFLKEGNKVVVLSQSGFSILEAQTMPNIGELYPAKEVHVSAKVWGPYEE